MQYHIPKNEMNMDEIYAVLSSDENGEGIVSANIDGNNFPLVFGHPRMLKKFKEFAIQMSKDTGKKLLIVKFKRAEILEEITTTN